MLIQNIKINDISSDYKGIAFINNKKCFIDDGIPNDIVDIEIYKETSKYLFAKIVNFLQKSEFRNKNILCKYFNNCGGCSLQHLDNNFYYTIKKRNVKNYIENSGYILNKNDIKIFKVDFGQRRRINLKYKSGIYGFYEKNSNNIVEINNCLNVTNAINNTIELLKNLNFKNLDSVDILDTGINININLIFNSEPNLNDFEQLNIFKNKNYIVNYSYKNEQIFVPIIKNDIQLVIDNYNITLPFDCFLQATEKSQNFMINLIKNELSEELNKNTKIADLYCGIGTYSFPLSNSKCKLFSFEGNKIMVENMKKNIIKNNIKNITIQQKDLFNQPISKNELDDFEVIIINPPRNGAENQCKNICKSKNIKKIIYISCNPETLSRDLKLFKNSNFKLFDIIIVDQFFLSTHVEIVVILHK